MNFRALIILLVAIVALPACATRRLAPRFDKPSTAAIAQSQHQAVSSVKSAQKKADQLAKDVPITLRLQVASLRLDLDNALTALDVSEGARVQLDAQLAQQTAKANNMADNYDKAGAQIESLKVSRHRWVKFFTASSLLSVGSLCWIFRKPILLLLGL